MFYVNESPALKKLCHQFRPATLSAISYSTNINILINNQLTFFNSHIIEYSEAINTFAPL